MSGERSLESTLGDAMAAASTSLREKMCQAVMYARFSFARAAAPSTDLLYPLQPALLRLLAEYVRCLLIVCGLRCRSGSSLYIYRVYLLTYLLRRAPSK